MKKLIKVKAELGIPSATSMMAEKFRKLFDMDEDVVKVTETEGGVLLTVGRAETLAAVRKAGIKTFDGVTVDVVASNEQVEADSQGVEFADTEALADELFFSAHSYLGVETANGLEFVTFREDVPLQWYDGNSSNPYGIATAVMSDFVRAAFGFGGAFVTTAVAEIPE